MRQLLLRIGMLLLMVLLITGLQAQSKLYIHAKDGTRNSFPLNEIRKVTLPSRTLIVVNNDGNTYSFPFVELRQARFTEWLTGNNSIDVQENKDLALYPNPVKDELTVRVISETSESIEIWILDVQGKTVYTHTGYIVPGTNLIKMQLSHLTKGLYVCRVNKSRAIETNKFMKN